VTRRLAFLTLDQRGDFVIDDELALAPLAELGWKPSVVSWRQTQIPWREFEAVVIRSTWDYWDDVTGFLDVLSAIDAATRLANPLGLVRWNLAKTYLRDLQRGGVPVVPTLWLDRVLPATLAVCFGQLGSDEIVVKPVIGANGVDAFRLSQATPQRTVNEVAARFPDRAAMAQPFMARILDEGEFSLFFFNGAYSHAILKVPAEGEFRSQEERGADIRSITPEGALKSCGERALATIHPTPLYARIDFVRDEADDYRVMELELIEPSLYLRTDPKAPARFAQAVDDWFRLDHGATGTPGAPVSSHQG
jgi:glutathione synthase/RimK-type ligase-like ATP-grasp enzyme